MAGVSFEKSCVDMQLCRTDLSLFVSVIAQQHMTPFPWIFFFFPLNTMFWRAFHKDLFSDLIHSSL